MASLNRVLIMGNLGRDPELRYTQNQMAVCSLTVATTDYRTGQDGQRQELTEWHRIVVWGKQAENCSKYLAKGRSVMVEGRLTTRSWEDKQGQKRYTTEIVAQNVQFIGGGQQRTSESRVAGASTGASGGFSGGYEAEMMGGSGSDLGGFETPSADDIPF
jgi:single-strand DNA-binding protein